MLIIVIEKRNNKATKRILTEQEFDSAVDCLEPTCDWQSYHISKDRNIWYRIFEGMNDYNELLNGIILEQIQDKFIASDGCVFMTATAEMEIPVNAEMIKAFKKGNINKAIQYINQGANKELLGEVARKIGRLKIKLFQKRILHEVNKNNKYDLELFEESLNYTYAS